MVLFLVLLLSLSPFFPSASLHIHNPQPYQVVQRTNGTADIWISGTVGGVTDARIEASWDGQNWKTLRDYFASRQIIYTPGTIRAGLFHQFGGILEAVPQGQYTLFVRVVGTNTVRTVSYVGVGDVFILAGQSNASGRGFRYQAYHHPTLKASVFGNDYRWRELSDPVDNPIGTIDTISRDTVAAGSYWPLLASTIMADQNVPIAFIPVAKGGTTITQWRPVSRPQPTTLYGAMWRRVMPLSRTTPRINVKAVLWHQGEQDAYRHLSAAQYRAQLIALANAIQRDFGAPLLVAKLQAIRTNPPVYTLRINQGIEHAINASPYILPGPDFSDMATDDLAHFQADAKLEEAAWRWWSALKAALYS